MKKINIKDIFIDINMLQVSDIKDDSNTLIIDIDGNVYFNEKETLNKSIIYKNDDYKTFSQITDIKELANKLFEKYKPEIIGTICRIKPLNNWQNIIDLNKNHMLYFDHQSDGVEFFEDPQLEDYGWNASVLEINYRQISEFIENNCEGTLLFYDNEIQFSGFAIVSDIKDVRVKVRDFIVTQTIKNKEDELFELDDEDVIESLEFFGIEV